MRKPLFENMVNTSYAHSESPATGDLWWPGRFALSGRGERRTPYLAGDARGEGGFSLIEVTIAMGVMAFAAIAILGIIPNGLAAATRSSQTTIAARLASEVQSEIQQVGLASFATDTTYFDGDGKILTSTAGAVYYVYRSVEDCLLPGASSGSFKKVIVQVVKNPAGQTFPVDATTGLRTIPSGMDERTFQFHVLP
jgi:uncharacterized protein (TIGR02598 family)